MVSILDRTRRLLRAYYRRGEPGLADLADGIHEEARRRPGGKFGKREARYLPQSPFPPTMWRYQCGRCRFWEEGGPGEAGTCHVVGHEDDPWGGEAIHPRGWCALYTPPAGEPAFAWLRERLSPDGASSVRGEYRSHLAGGADAGADGSGAARSIPVTGGDGDPGEERAGGTGADDGE